VRQSLASSTAERNRLPWCFSSFGFEAFDSVRRSAVPPAEPSEYPVVIQAPHLQRRWISPHVASVTWPSPPSATRLPRRTKGWSCREMFR